MGGIGHRAHVEGVEGWQLAVQQSRQFAAYWWSVVREILQKALVTPETQPHATA